MTLHVLLPQTRLLYYEAMVVIVHLIVIFYTIAPSPPSIISITSSTTTLTVRWDDGGYNYRLHVQKKGSTEIQMFGPVTPPYNITGLESNTEYTVVVEAYSLAGNANRSEVAYTLPECENYS